MSNVLKHWREAATLLLVAKTRTPSVTPIQTSNFQILMLKRSGKSKFMPKLHVFPGGIAHDSDFSSEWLNLFNCGGSGVVNSMQNLLSRGGKGAYIFSRTRPAEFSKIPSELAFRICAIRETFEESGILLVRDLNTVQSEMLIENTKPLSGKLSILSESILKPWRDSVDNDQWHFITMCRELNVLPDIWSLHEWSNWLTPILPWEMLPEELKGRRYDTAFFLSVLDDLPRAVECRKETTGLEVHTYDVVISQWFPLEHKDPNHYLLLASPQIIELGRILHFTDAEQLKTFAWERLAVRAQCWFPVTCFCKDGVLFLYPGDELYPEFPDREGKKPLMSVSETVEEMRIKFPNMNRTEFTNWKQEGVTRTFKCNVKMTDGQVSPLVHDMEDSEVPVFRL